MVELQILSKILNTGDISFLKDNLISHEYFEGSGYEDFAKSRRFKLLGNVMSNQNSFLIR